jgi:hypothetical protein
MLKNILNLEGAQFLSANEQKSIQGGTPVQPANCSCFCFSGHQKVEAYCNAYCPDGSLPGINVGSPSTCTSPMPPKSPPNPEI